MGKQPTKAEYIIGYNKQRSTALFWRRYAFVQRHGSESIVNQMYMVFDAPENMPEGQSSQGIERLNGLLMEFWVPVCQEFNEAIK